MDPLIIKNKGKEIVETNYFTSLAASAGKFIISLNAGAIRLLVPPVRAKEIRKEVLGTTRVQVEQRGEVAFITFDDGSTDPYVIQTTMNAFNPRPAASDSGKEFVFSVWDNLDGKISKFLEIPCTYIRFT